jgi:hypothetical protein
VLSADFARLYSKIGRPSIPPQKLLPALLLQAFYSVRSERQLMQHLDYTICCRPAGLSGCRLPPATMEYRMGVWCKTPPPSRDGFD